MKLYCTTVDKGFPDGSVGKESTCNTGDVATATGSILRLATFPGEGNGDPLQYSCLEILRTEEPGSNSQWSCK